MPEMPDRLRQSLSALRLRQAQAEQMRARQVMARVRAARELQDTQRRLGVNHKDTRAAAARYKETIKALKIARANESNARAELNRRKRAAFLFRTPEEDVALLSGAVPIVLLPVRLETRFVHRQFQDAEGNTFTGVLKVRIYPDAIAADSHEPRLTENELAAGRDYWRQAWAEADEAEAWAALVQETDAPRAAWIVKQTEPTNRAADFPTEPNGDGPPPAFPALETRPANWQFMPRSHVLPDRWMVIGYRQFQEVRRVHSRVVREPLALTMSLAGDGEKPQLNSLTNLSNGLEVDDEIFWTVNFEEALKVGMAVELPLTEEDFDLGFEAVLAVGVKASLDPAQARARLGQLMDAHHYSSGWSFVPQGAATNNVSDAPSWFPPVDPRGQTSFGVERGEPLVTGTQETDGVRFMRALGIPRQHAAHIFGADRDEQRAAKAMAEALWPCTLGHFLEHMMHPVVDDKALELAKRYFVDQVRARGHYPAFRVGAVPYGFLPVSFIDHWDPFDDPLGVEAHLVPFILRVRDLFFRYAASAPRINRSADADRDLLETLGMDASTREIWVRRVLGSDTQWNFVRFSGIDPSRMDETRKVIAKSILEGLGHEQWDPKILYTNFSNPPHKFANGLVVNDPNQPLSETDSLDFNYIRWIRTVDSVFTLRDERFPEGLNDRPVSLLYFMLRHAGLQQTTRSLMDILIERGLATRADQRERELIGITPDSRDAPTIWQRLETVVPGVTAGRPIAAILSMNPVEANLPPLGQLNSFRSSLRVLEELPTAELERLFTETLDVCSHRVDAWITSVVARRLEATRAQRPEGSHLAAYGWVENLKADIPGRGKVTEVDGKRVLVRDDSGGYVYAPSMTHGAAAAVLLNGYLTRQGEAKDRYAIDLSSARTRTALAVVDAVRNGQSLGAVLGYQFERGLHEVHPGVELDRFIDDFRSAYPIARNQARDANIPAEQITARHVVDGLALRLSWRGEPGFEAIPWASMNPSVDQRKAIEGELKRLDETVDAVADFLLADSVFQIVSGKMDAAGASLKAVGEGARPPEGDIAKVPRSGTSLSHRVAVIMGGDAIDLAALGWTGPHNARARAEPYLNGWVGRVLGRPDTVVCEVRFETGAVHTVRLDQLALDPLDVLAMAKTVAFGGDDSELDRRIRYAVGSAEPAGTGFNIRYKVDGLVADQRSFAVLLEVARALNELLGTARPLEPKDLIPPEQQADLGSDDPAIAPDRRTVELQDRAGSAIQRFDAARTALNGAVDALNAVPVDRDASAELTSVRAALRTVATYGFAGAFPLTFTGATSEMRSAIAGQATSVLRDVDQRRRNAADAAEPVAQLKAIFGREFVVLPRFKPARASELQAALNEQPQLGANPKNTMATWVAQTARVRKPLQLWRRVGQYATALATPLGTRRVVQLPFSPRARWVGLPFDKQKDRPLRGRVSMILYRAQAPAANQAWVGLLLDQWMESIPSPEEDVGVVFHHDTPGAQAPQAVLLAVPPTDIEQWNFDLLVNILRQTFFHAKVRGVDREDAEFLYGQLVPMIFLTQNTRNEAVSTALHEYLVSTPHLFTKDR